MVFITAIKHGLFFRWETKWHDTYGKCYSLNLSSVSMKEATLNRLRGGLTKDSNLQDGSSAGIETVTVQTR